MKKIDTILFDMDGTTLNTLEDLADSVNHVLSVYGFPPKTPQQIRQYLGNGVKKLMELSVPGGMDNPQFTRCLTDFQTYYEAHANRKTAPYPGILELLNTLHRRQYKMGIVSNKMDVAVKQLAQKWFAEYVGAAIGETEDIRRKPAPDTVLKALKILGSAPDRAILVGDSEVDVQTARNAGLICVGVTWGFRDREALEAEGADFIIDQPQQLLAILDIDI